jgi:hypothetical protein
MDLAIGMAVEFSTPVESGVRSGANTVSRAVSIATPER